jgi:nucleotide-binding universal stress UspA family protein
MRYLVGYSADDTGREALALGTMLARAENIDLEICTVMPETGAEPLRTPSEPGYTNLLREQAEEWLADARGTLDAETRASTRVHFAASPAAGLAEVAEQTGSSLIVVGSARSGLVRHFAVGSVAEQLLQTSPLPLALAPRGFAPPPDAGLSRVSCGYVATSGSTAALEAAVQLCQRNRLPLRLLTFMVPDHPLGKIASGDLERQAAEQSRVEMRRTLGEAIAALPPELVAETAVAEGEDLDAAFAAIEWAEGDLLVLGSSPLGGVARVFLGSTSSRMLRHAPVPVLVVPSEAEVSLEHTAEHQVSQGTAQR